jgi:hypothetical protein
MTGLSRHFPPTLAKAARQIRAVFKVERYKAMEVTQKTISMVAAEVVIIAHHEDTTTLEHVLRQEGFSCIVVRGPYTDEQKSFSAAIRCLINHANAWLYASKSPRPVIVCEADFVPCMGFGNLPAPFYWPPKSRSEFGRFAWLYSAGSILYGIDEEGYPHGHGNTTVAYCLSPSAAAACLEFFKSEMARPNPGEYRLWETQLGIFLRWKKGILNHIPIYQYGEHGGVPNKEHSERGVRSWHQADIMWDKLSFIPSYAKESRIRYPFFRARAWLRGCARLATLRFYHPRYVNTDSSRGRLYMLALSVARIGGVAHWIWPVAQLRHYKRMACTPN